jgi:hypothetical protein
MQQVTLDLDDHADSTVSHPITPEQEQQLIALMAKAIAAVLQNAQGDDHERS